MNRLNEGESIGVERVPQSSLLAQVLSAPVVTVPIGDLLRGDSPRSGGEVDVHVQALADSGDVLPPIIAHRSTMRVVDGMHRLRAALLRGDDEIRVRFFDGDERDAFVVAVRANVIHGLPLSLHDRREAAARILMSHPQWSDRWVASITGLAPRTVGGIRERSVEHSLRSSTRVGRDGRVRPVNSAEGRRLASELVASNPSASLREVAQASGLAPSTVLDVRRRLTSDQEPSPARRRASVNPASGPANAKLRRQQIETRRDVAVDRGAVMRTLRRDPSLRFNEAGRVLLRWLEASLLGISERDCIIRQTPLHCAAMVADLARENAQTWLEVAEQLGQRA